VANPLFAIVNVEQKLWKKRMVFVIVTLAGCITIAKPNILERKEKEIS
jgi:hypothetical protein